jgi:ABC-2 type transport system ATP-binding protein
MTTITINNITKAFGKTYALKDVSLTLESDRIYGLLGRNGAGKTTLINILTNKIFASAGEISMNGENIVENDDAQSQIYCMTEKNIHPVHMKVKDGFKWASEFYPGFDSEYAHRLSEKFELDTGKKINKLSSGYGSIFKLILTLSSSASVLIFDEPVLGLDATHRDLFYRELISYYSENPRLVLVATHLIDEVAEILEQVIVLDDGKVILDESVESVLRSAYSVSGEKQAVDEYSRNRHIIHEETMGNYKTTTIFEKKNADDKQIIDKLGLDSTPVKLQEVFVGLTG